MFGGKKAKLEQEAYIAKYKAEQEVREAYEAENDALFESLDEIYNRLTDKYKEASLSDAIAFYQLATLKVDINNLTETLNDQLDLVRHELRNILK